MVAFVVFEAKNHSFLEKNLGVPQKSEGFHTVRPESWPHLH